MTDTTVAITEMAILAGILLAGQLARLFPRHGRHAGHDSTINQAHARLKGPGSR